MYRLLETIRITNGKIENLEMHQRRVQRSSMMFHGLDLSGRLPDVIQCPDHLSNGIVKCRIIYSREIESVSFELYTPRFVRNLTLVFDDFIHYDHKFLDRSRIEKLNYKLKTDDILIVRQGLITDTSFSNIIFKDGTAWFTPAKPLLEGTKRAKLLGGGFIKEADIRPVDLNDFTEARLINAMLDPDDGVPLIPALFLR